MADKAKGAKGKKSNAKVSGKTVEHAPAVKVQRVEFDRTVIRPGATVRVSQRIQEGEKDRVQVFEGIVIRRRGSAGVNDTITVRKSSEGYGVERIYPLSLPTIVNIEVVRQGKVRRANLAYLRNPRAKKMKEAE